MAIFQYDKHPFHIDALEVFDFDDSFLGYIPRASSLLFSKSISSIESVTWIPGPFYPSRDAALQAARDFVRLNWEAEKSNRSPKAGDKVGQTTTNLVGKVVPLTDSVQAGYVDVRFGDDLESVPINELVFVN